MSHEQLFLVGVMVVADRRADQFGRDRAELHRTRGESLRQLPRGGVGLLVHREDRAGRPELRRHVPDRGAIGEPERVKARSVELDEHADHAALTQHLGDPEDEVGRGRALAKLAGELEAEHLRQQHRDRLAQHRGLGLDPAHAPAEHAESVDHGRVRVGPDESVGIRRRTPSPSSGKTTSPRYSRFTWWQMPVAGGTTRKPSNACWPQRRNP